VVATIAELQFQLDAPGEGLCDLKRMTVNVQKTHTDIILQIDLGMLSAAPGSLQARPLRWLACLSHLGSTLETNCGFNGAVEVMRSAATKAMWSVMRQAQDRDIQQIGI
jgi:hypothetical protein